MKITYAAKSNRKDLVKAIVDLTNQPSKYAGPPTYNFCVGDYTVDRNGDLILPDDLDETIVDELTVSLENLGFTYIAIQRDKTDLAPEADEDDPEETDEEDEDTDDTEDQEEATGSPEPEEEAEVITEEADNEPTQVTLSFPVSFFAKDAIERMRAIVASKATLLKKALDTDTLDIVVDGDKVYFPWFTDHGIEGECDAYSKLAFAIAKMAITQNRVNATEKQNPDEKLAMRLFLIRLNFIGDEYKSARAILMRNFNSTASRQKADAAVNLCMPEIITSPIPQKSAEAAREDDSDEE